MTYRTMFILTVFIPTCIIGGFEYLRHHLLLPYMSMEYGNLLITLLTLVLSYLFASWMFSWIRQMSERLAAERSRRAVYEERERLARELHDGIAQSLFFLNVSLKQGKLEEAGRAISVMDTQVRQAIFNLRSLPEESQSLCQRIDKWLADWSALSGIDVNQELHFSPGFFTLTEEIQIFGIVQEAFANIRKHADASQAWLSLLTKQDGSWELRIADNGKGIRQGREKPQNYGITIMQERAQQINAAFQLVESPQGGTEIRLTGKKGEKRS
ncbi:sensor histidine kinase [Brevibacillus fulvus]|uniref:histidine kinase n=1 Tax=Brevibacillus fulvus TaxID=1125967 RepID=A0A938XRE9_9BACL|nr:histidine kinase [Brevibacillus fulvus]MBM7588442.1 two-component system nitrate/nitrite sensor histidine kinase NarX [Brevibacillus fulvus]